MNEQLIFYSMNDNKIILDVESTGLDSENNYIAQLSYLIIGSEGQIAKNFFFSVPKMEKGAEDTHGLSKSRLQELSRGKTFRDHADEILNDFRKCNLCIGHNISFDLKFIKKEFERLGIKINYIQDKIYCTMHQYTDILKLKRYKHNDYKWPKLSEVVNFLNLDEQKLLDLTQRMYHISSSDKFNGYHDSRFDVICTYMIYLAKEAEDDESKELVYYAEKSNKNVNTELKKSKNNIFKDLFSFKGEISSKKYSILIWFLIILRAITLGIVKDMEYNNIELERENLKLILAMVGVISSFSIIPVTIKRLRTKKQSFWKILYMIIPFVNLIFISNLCTKSKTEIENETEKEYYKGKNKTLFKRLRASRIVKTLVITVLVSIAFIGLKNSFFNSEEEQALNVSSEDSSDDNYSDTYQSDDEYSDNDESEELTSSYTEEEVNSNSEQNEEILKKFNEKQQERRKNNGEALTSLQKMEVMKTGEIPRGIENQFAAGEVFYIPNGYYYHSDIYCKGLKGYYDIKYTSISNTGNLKPCNWCN